MNLLGPIKEIMQKDLITITPTTKLVDVGRLFKKHAIHHLPVTVGKRLVGIISKTDYLHFKRGFESPEESSRYELFRLKKTNAKEIMTTNMATLEPEDKINIALEIFNTNRFHAIPIVKRGRLVGLVTSYDIIHTISKDQKVEKKYTQSC